MLHMVSYVIAELHEFMTYFPIDSGVLHLYLQMSLF